MKKKCLSGIVVALMVLVMAAMCFASGGRTQNGAKKVGILLVAFGSSEDAARGSFENIERKVKAAFPGIPVRWAYTSHIIREKLAARGIHLDSPTAALAGMQDERFTHVAVQSLHTIAGAEYDDLKQTVNAFRQMGAFHQVLLGAPMMFTQEDLQRTVAAVLAVIPRERGKDDAVVLMGHGTHHPANAFYAALMFQLQLQDPNIFVGTVEGYPQIGVIQALMLNKGLHKAYLLPLMSVAGDHARNDMAGDESDSWKSVLTKAGFQCVPILRGTAEYDGFADIWVRHLREPLSHF